MKEFVQAAGFEPTLPPGLLASTISAMLAKKYIAILTNCNALNT